MASWKNWKLKAGSELDGDAEQSKLESESQLENFSNFVNFWELENI